VCAPDLSGSGQVSLMGCCEHGNESSGSVKVREFIDQLSDS
jgi:hypothetical protein